LNALALVVSLLWGAEFGVTIYAGLGYLLVAWGYFQALACRPANNMPAQIQFSLRYPGASWAVYRRYFLAICWPAGSRMFSLAINLTRLVGFIWAGVAYLNAHYITGTALVALFFIAGLPVVVLDPRHFLASAPPGHSGAMDLEAITIIDQYRSLEMAESIARARAEVAL
jgi:hypothetical protein